MKPESVWLATADAARHPFLDSDLDVDVAVVGAGIAGLTTALLAQDDGAQVAVLEAARVGHGTTGHTTGKVTSQHGLVYADLIARHGEDRARQYAQANQAAVDWVADLADKHGIACELTRGPAYTYTLQAQRRHELEEEAAAAQRLGLPAALADDIDVPFGVEAAVRFDRQIHFHPARYVSGLASAVVAGGGFVFEGARVIDVEEQRAGGVRVKTANATVRARHVVVATLLPIGLIGGYFARTRPTRSYGLACRLRGEAPQCMTISIDAPIRSTRPWLTPGRNGLIVVGNGHETGDAEVDTTEMYRDLEDWTRSAFDVEAVDYRWSAQDYTTADHVPYVGRAPLTEAIWVATGFKKWGLSNATAAAMMLGDLLAGRDNPWRPVFDAGRIGDAKAVGNLIKDNLQVAKEFVGARIPGQAAPPADSLDPGAGGIVEIDGKTVGAYRDAAGQLHVVNPTCAHLGCPVHWNAAETSWDCRCHGSRYDADGAILNGPTVKPLRQILPWRGRLNAAGQVTAVRPGPRLPR